MRSDLPDPNPANNALEWRVHVPPPPVLVLDDAPITEGTGPSDLRSVNALLSSPASADRDQPFQVNPVSAQATDFAALTGVFRFRRGTTTSSFRLIQGDTLPERPETFLLELLLGPVALARTSVVLTLEDDDLPRLTPRGTSLQEGNQGITQAAVPVVLSDPADYPVEVHYQTRPGNATAGLDFQDVSGWLRFEPGQRTNHVFVPILGDVQFEATESLEIFLTSTPNILLTRPRAVVTLLNDDPAPAPSLALRQHESGMWQVHFDTVDAARYQLQVGDSLGDGGWEDFETPILGTGQPASFPIPASLAPPQFFRIRVD